MLQDSQGHKKKSCLEDQKQNKKPKYKKSCHLCLLQIYNTVFSAGYFTSHHKNITHKNINNKHIKLLFDFLYPCTLVLLNTVCISQWRSVMQQQQANPSSQNHTVWGAKILTPYASTEDLEQQTWGSLFYGFAKLDASPEQQAWRPSTGTFVWLITKMSARVRL